MCIICVDLIKGQMTSAEAKRARREMVAKLDSTHLPVLEEIIAESEQKEAKSE
jgi:hypothetical protein